MSMDEPTEKTFRPPAEPFPQVNLIFEPLPAAAPNHGPTMARPTTGSGGRHPVTVVDTGKGVPVGRAVPRTGVFTSVACHGEGTRKMVKTRVVSPPPFFYSYCPPEEAGPLCPATARPPRERGKERDSEQDVERHAQHGRGGGGNKDHRRKSGGGVGSVKQRGGGLCVHNLLVGLLLMVVCGLGGVEGFAKLPNGDGALSSDTGNAGTLRRAVSDWIAGGALKSTVVATYGPIEDWDVSEVTNMKYVFYNFGGFNADLSKWNTGAVTTMQSSKCTLSPSLWPRLPLLCILNIRQLEFHRITILTRFVIFVFVFYETVLFFVVCGGLVFPFLCCTLSCSVLSSICVQSGRVQMEYGSGDKYAKQ